MEEELRVARRITESPAKLCVVVGDEVFRILVWVGGGQVGCLGPVFSFPGWGGACRVLGLRGGGGRAGGGEVQGLSHGVTGP